jgi:hypothetical protein
MTGKECVGFTPKQRLALEFLSFKYGNGGAVSTKENHEFLKRILEANPDASLLYHVITSSMKESYERICASDFRELSASQKKQLAEMLVG